MADIKLTTAEAWRWLAPIGPDDVCGCGLRWVTCENTATRERLCSACLGKRLSTERKYP